jgi:hypothetical protein
MTREQLTLPNRGLARGPGLEEKDEHQTGRRANHLVICSFTFIFPSTSVPPCLRERHSFLLAFPALPNRGLARDPA